MKTYIVDWFNKTRNGAWRDYRKVVQTDDIESHVRNKMKLLVVGCKASGQYKGTFSSATEVCKADKFGYTHRTVEGGEYWYAKDGKIECGTCILHIFYDHKLKSFYV